MTAAVTSSLVLSAVVAGYGGADVVHGVDLTVPAGQTVALLGANGAGKSTLLKTVLGLVPASSGRVMFDGEDITTLATERRVRLGIGYVPEGRRVFPGMSVRDNLEVASACGATGRRLDVERMYALFPALAEKQGEAAWRLSGGQQQMLAIARALMGRPRLLLLDEPSLGLSPRLANEVFAAISAIAASGTTVLLAEQSAVRAIASCQRLVLLRLGRILHDGPSDRVPDAVLEGAFLGQAPALPPMG